MKSLVTLAMIFMTSLTHGDVGTEKILKVDPYSVSSLEKYFPESVSSEVQINERSVRNFKKNEGPLTSVKKTVNYEILVPELIMVIKEQQKQIQELREALIR